MVIRQSDADGINGKTIEAVDDAAQDLVCTIIYFMVIGRVPAATL